MKIKSAEFVIGAAAAPQFPSQFLPEVGFVGKSNVGKSSLINSLLNRKHLVKTSSTPGKTQQINFFRINESFFFADLPGYGFSRAAKPVRESWEQLVTAYLFERPALRGVVVIVDIRHPPSPLDLRMVQMLRERGVRYLVVANKLDKLKRSQVAGALKQVCAGLGLPGPPLPCSAQSRAGQAELWAQLAAWTNPAPAVETAVC